ncbi:MAG TPA: hypothetical protein VIQ00_12925 [Chitinophagaceae bacterium]|jgi:Uncharacterized conserved protein, contains double-stranded beta-helix domain
MNVIETISLNDERPAVLQIKNTDKSQVMAIGLKKNQALKKHTTANPALLLVLKGSVSSEMEDTITQISAFNTFDIPANIFHEVVGVEESIFLLIKEKPGLF